MSNLLAKEDSLYLKQHAENPVDWFPYGDDAIQKAKKEDKLLLISIGYSSCHWCHVMEKECFEDQEVAKVMNKGFINIKVDREERPDIDAIYMEAVQLMNNGQGGWPLNCIALPDGTPVFGGTYFPKEKWINILKQLTKINLEEPQKIAEFAENVKGGMSQVDTLVKINDTDVIKDDNGLKNTIFNWLNKGFDLEFGGNDRVPKFPMPVNFLFLIQHLAFHPGSNATNNIIKTTLNHIALGGIHDHVEGGITRYSTDRYWKVPHFEKMLYDNAQMLSLYALGCKSLPCQEYLYFIEKTCDFLNQKLKAENGLYYASIDADSDGEEGKYYVFNESEINQLNEEFQKLFFKYYYWDNENSLWENNKHVLVRKKAIEENEINELKKLNIALLALKKDRTYPTIDTKILSGWNALLAIGFLDVFKATQEDDYRELGINLIESILNHLVQDDFNLMRSNARNSTQAFLDDYALLIRALIKAYQVSGKENYIVKAQEYANYVINHFYESEKGYFTLNHKNTKLFHQSFDLVDNVIPSSNSIMAHNLFELGRYFESSEFLKMSKEMLAGQLDSIKKYTGGYANWLSLWEKMNQDEIELVFNNYSPSEVFKNLGNQIHTALIAYTNEKSILPLNQNRWVKEKKLVYRCANKSCELPKTIENLV